MNADQLKEKTGITHCQKCGTTKRLSVDHIIPKSKGGAVSHISNLTLLCVNCNTKKGNAVEDAYDDYYHLSQLFTVDNTAITRATKRYGGKFFAALLSSSVNYKFSDHTVIHHSDMGKLNEYLGIYGLRIPQEFKTIKLPVARVSPYLAEINPNYELRESVIHSYIHHLDIYIS